MTHNPHAFVVAAPSGTGKTTLNRRLLKEFNQIEFSVSLTTRPIRPGEVDGDHYHFVDNEQFDEEIKKDRMLEWAEVFGNRYGTSLNEVERIFNNGKDVLLEIDVQGWHYARKKITNATSIFIIPPSMEELWQRLAKRGTDSLESRLKRFKTAREELEKCEEFHQFIINDDIEEAYKELKNIIIYRKVGNLTPQQGVSFCRRLMDEYDQGSHIDGKFKSSHPSK
ncbi:MAG: guanylate kinase [Bdellovibrionota bacterium]